MIVWFTALYYSITARDAIEGLKDYYSVLGRQCSFRVLHHHFYCFALTILDRVLVNMKLEQFSFEDTGNNQAYQSEIRSGGAKVIISAHVGSWQMASDELSTESIPINIVAYQQDNAELNELSKGEKGQQLKIINFSDDFFSNITKINKVLSDGEMIAMQPDRFVDMNNTVEVTFLNKKTRINSTPFMISYIKKVPVVNIFTTRVRDKHYQVNVESVTHPDRKMKRNAYIQYAADVYIRDLENIVKRNPDQWFNFYKFWDMERFDAESLNNRR